MKERLVHTLTQTLTNTHTQLHTLTHIHMFIDIHTHTHTHRRRRVMIDLEPDSCGVRLWAWQQRSLFCAFWRSFPGTQPPLTRVCEGVLIFWSKWHFWFSVASLSTRHPVVGVWVRGCVTIYLCLIPHNLGEKVNSTQLTLFHNQFPCGTSRHYRLKDNLELFYQHNPGA